MFKAIKKILVNLLICTMSVTFTLIALEILLRLAYFADKNPKETSPHIFYMPDDDLGWFHKPNSQGRYTKSCFSTEIKINSEGLRDYEHEISNRNGTYRVLVLGDSTSEGLQIDLEKIYSSRAQNYLNDHQSSIKYEFINLSVSSYGTDQEYLALKKFGIKYKPNLIILAVYLENDVFNNSIKLQGQNTSKPYFVINNNEIYKINSLCKSKALMPCWDEPEKTNIAFKFVKILHNKSKIYQLVERKIISIPMLHRKIYPSRLIYEAPRYLPSDFYLYLKPYNVEFQNAWEITKKIIKKIKDVSFESNSKLLVLILPSKLQISGIESLKKQYPEINDRNFNLSLPNLELTNYLRKSNIDYIDYLPKFKATFNAFGNIDTLYLPCDGHYSEEGHNLIANELIKKLY